MPESVQRWHYRLVHFVPDPFVDERILVAVVVIGDRTEVLRRPIPRLDPSESRLVTMCLDALASQPAPATSVPVSWSEHMAMGALCQVPEGVEDVRQWAAKAFWPDFVSLAARIAPMLCTYPLAMAKMKREQEWESERFSELLAELGGNGPCLPAIREIMIQERDERARRRAEEGPRSPEDIGDRDARIAEFQAWSRTIPEPGSSVSAQDVPDVRPHPRGFRAWAEQSPAVVPETSVLAWEGSSGPMPDEADVLLEPPEPSARS